MTVVERAKARVLHRWDMLVYRMAYRSLSRLMRSGDGGFGYLMELSLRTWRENNPLPEPLERATETFHAAMVDNARARKALGVE